MELYLISSWYIHQDTAETHGNLFYQACCILYESIADRSHIGLHGGCLQLLFYKYHTEFYFISTIYMFIMVKNHEEEGRGIDCVLQHQNMQKYKQRKNNTAVIQGR